MIFNFQAKLVKPILRKRQQLIFWIYQFYLDPKVKQHSEGNNAINLATQDLVRQQMSIIEKKLNEKISPHWSWHRINNLHKAVLVQAVFEFDNYHVAKPIVIDQAIEFIKKFDAEQQYQFVNAVLNAIL